jgi:hypothetical protein
MQDQAETVREIETAASESKTVPAVTVRQWLQSESLEVLGAVIYHFIRHSRRINPALSMDEICKVMENYYRQCLISNLDRVNYVSNRHISGRELVGWFGVLWHDSNVDREYLVRLKIMLRDLCLGEKVPENDLVTSVLEHLFETPEIAKFFNDWRSHPVLGRVYREALEWTEKFPDRH